MARRGLELIEKNFEVERDQSVFFCKPDTSCARCAGGAAHFFDKGQSLRSGQVPAPLAVPGTPQNK